MKSSENISKSEWFGPSLLFQTAQTFSRKIIWLKIKTESHWQMHMSTAGLCKSLGRKQVSGWATFHAEGAACKINTVVNTKLPKKTTVWWSITQNMCVSLTWSGQTSVDDDAKDDGGGCGSSPLYSLIVMK